MGNSQYVFIDDGLPVKISSDDDSFQLSNYSYARNRESVLYGLSGGAETRIVDDFSDGDISEYGGDTGQFSVVNNELKCYRDSGSFSQSISSTSGLSAYPQPGDTFECSLKFMNPTNMISVRWATQSESADHHGYGAHIDHDENEVFWRVWGGSNTVYPQESVTLSTDTWYTFSIDWGTNGTITVELLDPSENVLYSSTETNTEWTSGGVGFGMSVGDFNNPTLEGYYDDFIITNR